MELLVWGFLKRKREIFCFFFLFSKVFYFFNSFLTKNLTLISTWIFYLTFLHHFSKKGVFIGKMREWEASISVPCYTSACYPFKDAASIGVPWYTNVSYILIRHVICFVSIFRLFLIFGPIFVRPFGGLSELFFLWISYSLKAIYV